MKLFDSNPAFSTELERNSYYFHNRNILFSDIKRDKIESTIIGSFVGGFLGFILGLANDSWILFLVSLFALPCITYYLTSIKIEFYQEFSKTHEIFLTKIEKEVRREIVAPYVERYLPSKQVGDHIPDLINLINHKKNVNLTSLDGLFLLLTYEKETNLEIFDRFVSELKIRSTENYAKILIGMYPGKNFENEKESKSIIELFIEYQKRKNILCDVESLKHELISQYKRQKALHFEEKLSRNHKNKISVEEIGQMNGYEFEQVIGHLYRKAGYKVEVTKKTGDQGADLVIVKDGISTAIQAKRYSGTVGNKAVQEIVAAMKYYDCDNAMVITTGDFTRSAYELAKSNNVQLIDRKALDNLFDTVL